MHPKKIKRDHMKYMTRTRTHMHTQTQKTKKIKHNLDLQNITNSSTNLILNWKIINTVLARKRRRPHEILLGDEFVLLKNIGISSKTRRTKMV